MSEWRPIDTAPKDGSHVMLGDAPEQYVCEGYYEEDGDRGWYMANTHWTDAYDGRVYPTHWQPLPSPPEMERTK